MLYNTFAFGIFLIAVFIVYWFLLSKSNKLQNYLLLAASWFFYGWWDWRFLAMFIALSVMNYILALALDRAEASEVKRLWLILGVVINLGTLAVFKYFDFFVDSFIDLVSLFGYDLPHTSTRFVLPLGISFYVFLALSYLLDVKKGAIKANTNLPEVLLTLQFFPIILAGPIQRPAVLMPQIASGRTFDYAKVTDGLRQILWGLFTKVVIADNLSSFADDIFNNYNVYSGSTLLTGAVFYSIQIYADFSGYSNIAIGTGKLLGFDLIRNFAFPYFARDITEFWKRWHISLTTWFRDYLFLPLSFSFSYKIKGDKVLGIKSDLFIYIMASLLTWLLTGLWHGANYTFIIWGLIHGVVLIVYHWQKNPRKAFLKKKKINNNNRFIVIPERLFTLFVVLISWIFFRSASVGDAFDYLGIVFSGSLLSMPEFPNMKICLVITILAILFIYIEWLGKESNYAIENVALKLSRPVRWSIYYTMVIVIFFFAGIGQKFIYFQF